MDWTQLQRHAAELRHLAEATRAAAAAAAATEGVRWRSTAAGRFRSALREEAARTRHCADLLDDAARAMDAHATAVRDAPEPPATPAASR